MEKAGLKNKRTQEPDFCSRQIQNVLHYQNLSALLYFGETDFSWLSAALTPTLVKLHQVQAYCHPVSLNTTSEYKVFIIFPLLEIIRLGV